MGKYRNEPKRPGANELRDLLKSSSGSSSDKSSAGTHTSTNKDGSTHVSRTTDGAHVSYDVQKDGSVKGWHGTIHDTTGKGEHIIVERKDKK